MIARHTIIFALSLCLAAVSFGAEPDESRPPRKLSPSTHEKNRKLSALDHIRVATEQLEAAGLTKDAVKLRELSEQLNKRVIRERAELSRQITELQKQSKQLRLLTGSPDKILCRCCFLELSSKAAAEFAAAVELVSSPTDPQNHATSAVVVYKNAEEVIQQLKKSGKVRVVHASPQIVTKPGQPGTFKSGGEFPVVSITGKNQTSIEWKRFGVFCKVEPRLIDTEKIHLRFTQEISHRDFKNAVKIDGLTVPALMTRRVNTTAEMNLGETLVVRTVSNRESRAEVVNAESNTAPPEKTVTLFMVTPVAFD